MVRFFEPSKSDSSIGRGEGQGDGRQPSPASPDGLRSLSRSDRRRRQRRAAARRRVEERSLAQERLESRIALSVNVAGYEDAVDFFLGSGDSIDPSGSGYRVGPHSPQHFVHGRAVIASDDGDDVYIRQVASVTQDLIVGSSSNFLNYQIIDGIDERYQQIFVTNGTRRVESDPILPDSVPEGSTGTRFMLTGEDILFTPSATVNPNGTIHYRQSDGVVSSWDWDASALGPVTILTGPGVSTPLPAGYIFPLAMSLTDEASHQAGLVEQAYLDVVWSGVPVVGRTLEVTANYVFDDSDSFFDPIFRSETLQANAAGASTTLTFTLPGALATAQDGVAERQSLGIIPGTLRGEDGAIRVRWSDGITYALPAFRADVDGVLRFNTFAAPTTYTESVYKDSSTYFSTDGTGIIDVRGRVSTSGVLTLEFRRWANVVAVNSFTDELGRSWTGFEYPDSDARSLPGVAGPVVVQGVSYLTYTRDAEPNSVTFVAGQTVSREVTIDLLTPGSTINIDSPIIVNTDPLGTGFPRSTQSYFQSTTAEGLQLPDIDLRATNVNVRATVTTPDRFSVGRSQVARERLSIPRDDVNPYLLSPSMPSLYDRDPPDQPILPNGGFPELRTARAIAEMAGGQVVGLAPLPGFQGFGYDPDSPPVVTIAPPAVGTPATAEAIVGSDGTIAGYLITNPGAGYSGIPSVVIADPIPQRRATARVAEIDAAAGEVVRVDVLDPGYRYHAPPRVVISPPGRAAFGVQATARAVLDNEGRISGIEVIQGGSGYSERPEVTIAEPSPPAMAERLVLDAVVRANVFELYVGDDFGTEEPRGFARLSSSGTLATEPTQVEIASIVANPTSAPAAEQRVVFQGVGGGALPAGFNPLGVAISGVGIREGTRVLAYDPVSFTATLAPGSVSESLTLPITADLSVRADSLYLEATTADVYFEGLVNVEKQSYLFNSPPSAAHLAPFVFTTRSTATGSQTGTVEGGIVDIVLGNDAPTPLTGATVEHEVDLRTEIASLRVRAASSATDPQGPYPYRLTIEEQSAISLDAVAASSLPISIAAKEGITLSSAVDTDGDFSLNAQSDEGSRTTLRVTAPIRTRYGQVVIAADTVEVRNSLEVTSAAVVDGRQDVRVEARGGSLVLQGNVYAPNEVVLEQVDRIDDVQQVRVNEFLPVAAGATVQRVRLSLPDGGVLPNAFDPTGLGIEAADPQFASLVSSGARITVWESSTSTATLPFLYANALDEFYSATPLVDGGGVNTNVARVTAAVTPLLGGGGTQVAVVEAGAAWIADAQFGDFVSFRDAAGNSLFVFRSIEGVDPATGELRLSGTIPTTAAGIEFVGGTQWSRRVNPDQTLEFLDSAGRSLGTAEVLTINRSAGLLELTSAVPVGSFTIRRPPTVLPVAGAPGSPPLQIRLSSSVRSVSFGEIDASLARVVADEVSIVADGKVSLRTDANRLRATAGRGFTLSERNDIDIPLLAAGGMVSLEALGVDQGPRGQNAIALTASLIDVGELVVNTPNGSARINSNIDSRLLVGDAASLQRLGDRAATMLAAGDVTIRSQAGDIVLLDAPLAGGNARQVRVATRGPLPATATYLPGNPGVVPSMLSGAGSINSLGADFWGLDATNRPIALAVGDLVLVKDQQAKDTSLASVDPARENGVYRVAALGGGAYGTQRWQLVRDTASDTVADMPNGTLVRVVEGEYSRQVFAITYDAIVPTLVERVGTNQLQFAELFPSFDLLKVGGIVNGTGIAQDSYITAVDPIARVVTLDVVRPGQVFDSGLGSATVDSTSGGTIVLSPAFTQYALLEVGQQVTGPGILSDSVITRIDPGTRSIDVAVTVLGPAVVSLAGATLTFDPVDTDPAFTQFSQLTVGQRVQLYDDEANLLGTRSITAVDPLGREVTLDGTVPGVPVMARIWTPGALPAVLSAAIGTPRATSMVLAANDALAGIRVGQRFQLRDSGGITVGGPQVVTSVNVRVGLDGSTVVDDVTIGFGTILTPAEVTAVSGGTIEFLPPDAVEFGAAGPGSVPVTWNSWAALNEVRGTILAGTGTATATLAASAQFFGTETPVDIPWVAAGNVVEFRDPVGIPLGTATITGIDRGLRQVSFTAAVPAGSTQLAVYSRVVTLPNFADFPALTPGLDVSGPGILPGTSIDVRGVNPGNRTITITTDPTGPMSAVSFGIGPPARYPASDTLRLDPLFTNYERLFEGQRVYGAGIEEGAVIVSVDSVAGTVSLTPGSVGTDRGPVAVTRWSAGRSPYYPERFDDWIELDDRFNDFAEIKVGQRIELLDAAGLTVGLASVTGVDARYRTVGLENGSLNGLVDDLAEVRFLPVSNVRFGVIDGVGSGLVELLLQPVGLTPISVEARAVTTNIGSDFAERTVTFVASTDGRTNQATGSLGKMLDVYQGNDTSKTQVDVAVFGGDGGVTKNSDGTWTLRLDPLFNSYDRLEAIRAEWPDLPVSGTPRMFTVGARIVGYDAATQTVRLGPGSMSLLAEEDLTRVGSVTLPIQTTNPDQDQEFRFWSWMTGNIQLQQELPEIRRAITIDGSLVSTDGGTGAPRLGPIQIDGQRISRNREGGVVTSGQQIDGFEIVGAGADGSKIARLSIGGFVQGSGIKIEGASGVVIEAVNVGRRTDNTRIPNARGVTVVGQWDGNTDLLLQAAENNTILDSTVVGGLSAGIVVEQGANRTYVIGGSVGTASIDNQVGIFVAGPSATPARPAPTETSIGANAILPSQTLLTTSGFVAGSNAIVLPSSFFTGPLIGLELVFENLRVPAPVPERTLITGIDSTARVAYLSNPATVTSTVSLKLGHVAERLAASGDFDQLKLPASVPLDEVYVGLKLSGPDLPQGGVTITAIDREQGIVRLSQPFGRVGRGLVTFAAPGQTVVRGNRTGILLRGEGSRVTNTAVIENTRSGIDVVTPGQQIGSPATFGEVVTSLTPGAIPIASWPANVILASGAVTVRLPSSFTAKASDIPVGTRVYGTAIAAGTTVAATTVSSSGVVSSIRLSAPPMLPSGQSSLSSLIGFGVTTNGASVEVAPADRIRLFVGQDVHAEGLPEFTQISGLRLTGGAGDYVLVSPPATSLGAANFAALAAGSMVFAERTSSSNRIYGNGEYGILVRHPDEEVGSASLRTRIFANYFGLFDEAREAPVNRLGPLRYEQESAWPYVPTPRHVAGPVSGVDLFANKYATGEPTPLPGSGTPTGPLPPGDPSF